jgi:hypothetical protein
MGWAGRRVLAAIEASELMNPSMVDFPANLHRLLLPAGQPTPFLLYYFEAKR